MMRDPWSFAAALIAFGIIGWLLVAAPPQKRALRLDTHHSLSADTEGADLRLISERNPFMRTER
jgi:hypothetical protein